MIHSFVFDQIPWIDSGTYLRIGSSIDSSIDWSVDWLVDWSDEDSFCWDCAGIGWDPEIWKHITHIYLTWFTQSVFSSPSLLLDCLIEQGLDFVGINVVFLVNKMFFYFVPSWDIFKMTKISETRKNKIWQKTIRSCYSYFHFYLSIASSLI